MLGGQRPRPFCRPPTAGDEQLSLCPTRESLCPPQPVTLPARLSQPQRKFPYVHAALRETSVSSRRPARVGDTPERGLDGSLGLGASHVSPKGLLLQGDKFESRRHRTSPIKNKPHTPLRAEHRPHHGPKGVDCKAPQSGGVGGRPPPAGGGPGWTGTGGVPWALGAAEVSALRCSLLPRTGRPGSRLLRW